MRREYLTGLVLFIVGLLWVLWRRYRSFAEILVTNSLDVV